MSGTNKFVYNNINIHNCNLHACKLKIHSMPTDFKTKHKKNYIIFWYWWLQFIEAKMHVWLTYEYIHIIIYTRIFIYGYKQIVMYDPRIDKQVYS